MGYSFGQLQQLAQQAGFRPPADSIMAAIALAESGGNPSAVGDQGTSYGLWQIHLPAHPNISQACAVSPPCAAQAAYSISSGGTNFHPWSTYTSGAYSAYLQAGSQAAATPSTGGAPATTSGLLSSGSSFVRWLLAFGVLGAVLLVVSEDQRYREVGFALAWLIAAGAAVKFGPEAWKEAQSLFSVSLT